MKPRLVPHKNQKKKRTQKKSNSRAKNSVSRRIHPRSPLSASILQAARADRSTASLRLSPPSRNVTLSKAAFMHMVVASVETYKKETFGLLLGSMHKKHYMVNDVVPVQMATRDYEFVAIKPWDVNRINYTLLHLSDHELLGDFHAHPDFPEHLSNHDKQAFREGGTPLAMLVLVKKTHKHQPWQKNEDLSISGTVGHKFFVKVMGFECDKPTGRITRLKVICPSILGFNGKDEWLHRHPLVRKRDGKPLRKKSRSKPKNKTTAKNNAKKKKSKKK